MGKSAKVTEFLKECIADSLILLLNKKPYEKITVEDIVKNAGVCRATYFRHFQSKDDVLIFKLIKMWERWADEHHIIIRNDFAVENAMSFFEFQYSIRTITSIITKVGLEHILYQSFNNAMAINSESDTSVLYKKVFYSYGLFGLVSEWIKRDFRESIDEMVEEVKNMF